MPGRILKSLTLRLLTHLAFFALTVPSAALPPDFVMPKDEVVLTFFFFFLAFFFAVTAEATERDDDGASAVRAPDGGAVGSATAAPADGATSMTSATPATVACVSSFLMAISSARPRPDVPDKRDTMSILTRRAGAFKDEIWRDVRAVRDTVVGGPTSARSR